MNYSSHLMKLATIFTVIIALMMTNIVSHAEQVKMKPEASHIVRPGETLWLLAKVYHTTPDVLRKINQLKDNFIYVGQVLIVVGEGDCKALNDQSFMPVHYVEVGDTLWSICKFHLKSRGYVVSVEELKKWNNIKDVNKLHVGQKLYLANPVSPHSHLAIKKNPSKREVLPKVEVKRLKEK